ncbi:hypothetical protein [Ruegeria atlantica]|uniref:hypothetical protein n=1 Tax=Ruegeria atlantica TaxID=81569 RepID=UPI00147EDEC8|nr:hypothetical protein [Ruegeria atlantica]
MTARATYRLLAILLCVNLLAGCAGSGGHGSGTGTVTFSGGTARVSDVQACAIGYDMARQIHDRVSLRRTVLLAPPRATACEAHALEYLRRAGFRIDTTGQGGTRINIALSRPEPEIISAVARIGDDLRIARSYQPARTGVVAAGPVSIQHLAPDTFDRRGSGT